MRTRGLLCTLNKERITSTFLNASLAASLRQAKRQAEVGRLTVQAQLAQFCAESPSACLPLPDPTPRVPARKIRPSSESPSQHVGLFRAAMLVAGALSTVWQEGHVLVDSGSQQVPLLAHDFAAAVAGPRGPIMGFAAQADGSLLKLYSVPPVDLCVNGVPQRVRFQAADIAPYDCILGILAVSERGRSRLCGESALDEYGFRVDTARPGLSARFDAA